MSEEEMIKAILKGDQKAFKLLVDNYQLMVVNTCHAFVHDRDEAEDIAQDVFLKIINNIDTIQTENPLRLRALIIQMTKFASIDLLRKKKHKENPNDLINDWEQFPAVTTDIEECVFSHELINMAVNFVSQMDEKYRAPLTLAVLGYRIKEIASLLGMSEANTKVRISRARHMLRAYILQEENQVEQEHDIS
jgi:RNA polymerase sigma-70 factor (ECF subfamily)